MELKNLLNCLHLAVYSTNRTRGGCSLGCSGRGRRTPARIPRSASDEHAIAARRRSGLIAKLDIALRGSGERVLPIDGPAFHRAHRHDLPSWLPFELQLELDDPARTKPNPVDDPS